MAELYYGHIVIRLRVTTSQKCNVYRVVVFFRLVPVTFFCI